MPRHADPKRPCPLCLRQCPAALMERHHLRTKKADKDDVELICRQCHRTIHALFTNAELRDPDANVDQVEGLLQNPRFASALRFIRKQPASSYLRVHTAADKRRKRRR